MKLTIWISAVALLAVGILVAQGPAGPVKAPAKGQTKAPPRDPTQSPASRPRPQTVTPQTYPVEQVQAGEQRFSSECGFCHGRDAAGGETGPDLTRSELVANDARGNLIGPLLRAGRPAKGMPAFSLNNADLGAIVAFIHDQKTKSETLGGGRRSVTAEDLSTGNRLLGRDYFNGEGGCVNCHFVTGDLAGIGKKYQGLALLQRMLYPSGRPAPAMPKVTLTLASGQTISAPLENEDEFSIVVLDPKGVAQTYQKNMVTFRIEDPMSAHFEQLGKYTDKDMHNVFVYLETLK